MTVDRPYVHGHGAREHARLQDQAATLAELLHADTHYAAGSRVLEVGCGVGAQTVQLAQRSPDASIVAVDVDESSVRRTRQRMEEAAFANVSVRQADVFALPFEAASFDHIFVCFVLEHLSQPAHALSALHALLRPQGTITVIEGDHGATVFHPESEAARAAIACQVTLQRRAGGDPMIGRRLHPLLVAAGFRDVRVSPRMAYADASRPEWVEGFTRKTFTAMIEGVREAAITAQLIDAQRFDQGLHDLHRTAEPDGVFCYTFFKAVAQRE